MKSPKSKPRQRAPSPDVVVVENTKRLALWLRFLVALIAICVAAWTGKGWIASGACAAFIPNSVPGRAKKAP